jgi:transcription elongation factor GreA
LTPSEGRGYDPRRPDFGRASMQADARGSFPSQPPHRLSHLTAARRVVDAGPCGRSTGGRSSVNNKPTYLSREGEAGLRLELEQLVNVRRSEVAARIHDAKEHGDLSENAEYEEAKNEQAFVEGRIQTLEGMLKTAVIIEHGGSEHVALGSSVTVASNDGQETFAIVGSAEARPAQGRISNESPVGRALLGKKAGDRVVVKLPNGSEVTYTIISII